MRPGKRAVLAGGIVLALGLSAGIAVYVVRAGGPSGQPASALSLTTTRVVRTDLHSTQTLAGTLTWDAPTSVAFAVGTDEATVEQARHALASAQQQLAAARTAVGDATAAANIAAAQQRLAIQVAQQTFDRDRAQQQSHAADLAADQATLAAQTQQVEADQAAVTAIQQQLQGDQDSQANLQHAQLVDQQDLAAASSKLADDRQRVSTDCTTSPPSQQCLDGQAAVTTDQAAVSAAQSRVNADALALQQIGVTLDHDNQTSSSAQAALGTDSSHQAQTADAVAADQHAVDADGEAVAQATLALAQANEQASAVAQQAKASVHQAQSQASAQEVAADAAGETAARDAASEVNPGGILTAVPQAGQVITQGHAMYAVDGVPVPLLYGTTVPWRALYEGVPDGPDVTQLQEALKELGFGADLHVGPHFSAALTTAVKHWQASLGAAQTGVVRLGDVVVAPGALRIANMRLPAGAGVQPGTQVADVTSNVKIVTATIDSSQLSLAQVGDQVTVQLPNGAHTAGHVRTVTTPASQPDSQRAATAASSPANGAPSDSSPVVTVNLDDPQAAEAAATGPVQLTITDQTATNVLAVPITALLALAEGGDGIEIVDHGQPRIVAVRTGLFAGTQVEISGPGISAGTVVEVPAT